jgi:hypothetical protein
MWLKIFVVYLGLITVETYAKPLINITAIFQEITMWSVIVYVVLKKIPSQMRPVHQGILLLP